MGLRKSFTQKVFRPGFSLMEMMIVLLIVAIVAAASAPMINKKMMSNASERSPWVWTGQDNNIAFNLSGDEKSRVIIGSVNPPEGVNSILHLNGSLSLPSGCMLSSTGESVALTNKEDNGENSVVVGFGASAAKGSIAIGKEAKARHESSVAIGKGAVTYKENQIVLGNENTTVLIPGHLVTYGDTILASDTSSHVFMRIAHDGNADGWKLGGDDDSSHIYYIKRAGGNDDSDNNVRMEGYISDLSKYTGKGTKNRISIFGVDWSDRRLKNVGKASTAGLEEIKKLEVFNYTFKKDKSKTPRVGVMAQDLQKIFPNAVTKGEDGFLMIRMEDMFYAMVNAVKELANRDDSQAKKIQELEKQNKEILKQNKDLIKRLETIEKKIK